MSIEFGLTKELVNTQFAPVAALSAYHDGQKVFEPLQKVVPVVQKRDFSLPNQLEQVVVSILTGCEYLSVVNTKLRSERVLAQVYRINGFANQSTLSRSLDGLSLAHLSQLQDAVQEIGRRSSRIGSHNWRGFLELDFDLSGLPCGKQAEKSEKGYFSGKKTLLGGN